MLGGQCRTHPSSVCLSWGGPPIHRDPLPPLTRLRCRPDACHLLLVLLACLRASGLPQAQVPWQASLAAFAFVRLLSALPITPGGIGVVETGLTAGLAVGHAPAEAAKVAAAVLESAGTAAGGATRPSHA
jgi:hypothetical protein